MALRTHPLGDFDSALIAGDHSPAAVGRHAQGDAVVLAQVVKMGLPGRGRPIGSQRNVQDGGTLGCHGDSNGLMDGEHLLTEVKHAYGRRRRQGQGERWAVALEQDTEVA